MIIALLLDGKVEVYNKIKKILSPEDFKRVENKEIVQKLYEEFEKGNSNIDNILEIFNQNEKIIGILTGIMAEDNEIKDDQKAIEDLVKNYKKERLLARKKEIIKILESKEKSIEETKLLEKELQNLIINLTQLK